MPQPGDFGIFIPYDKKPEKVKQREIKEKIFEFPAHIKMVERDTQKDIGHKMQAHAC